MSRPLKVPVTPPRPNRDEVRALLNEAFDVPPEERRAFLEARLPPGETLEAAAALLREVENVGDFLEQPLVERPAEFRPPVPARVGPYRVERLLGFGSMGVVYLAQQEAPRRPIALKVLRLDAASENAARRFKLEGELLARLSHPGIAAVHAAGLAELGAGPQPFLAMEYVDGEPITVYAERADLPRRERVELVWKVARAVAHAHSHGVLHRDLKPENVLVRANGEPVVLDFGAGLSTSADTEFLHLTVTGQVVGTLAYMAPEQARGGTVDERADQFALGAILYELLTGELPFAVRGRLPHEALRIVADAQWTSPSVHAPDIPSDLEAILAMCLAAEPVRRYASVADFAADLERWLNGKPVHARPPAWHEVLGGFVRRNRALSVSVLTGLLAIGGAAAWSVHSLFGLHREEAVSLLFSDLRLLSRLEEEAQTLWPTSSATLPAFDRWLQTADGLRQRLPQHRATLERIDSSRPNAPDIEQGARWTASEGLTLILDLEQFLGPEGLVADVSGRRARPAELRTRTLVEAADAWRDARRRVAKDPRFAGLELPPQEGLVPLGPDPDSHLEEFAVWLSGTIPERDPLSGRIEPRPEHAIVLVLVPGGECWIGSQEEDPEGVHYDPDARLPPHEFGNEGPPFCVRLDPFLISKYEMTQAQWVRAFGFNPSDWEETTVIRENRVNGLHPVESFSWETACELLPHLGLTLPTEAQWEVAARGGRPYAYVEGPRPEDLVGYINWNCETRVRPDLEGKIPPDGYFTHSPVGTWKPNAFGLHDTLGNVWEYCLDTYKVLYHQLEHRPGDGLVIAEPDGDVSRRGGCMYSQPEAVRVAWRAMKRFDGRDTETGVRPARALILNETEKPVPSGDVPND